MARPWHKSTRVEKRIATGRLWPLCADRGHEPLPMWLLWRPDARVHLLAADDVAAYSGAATRSASRGPCHPVPAFGTGPHRHPRRGASGGRALRASDKLSDERLGEPSASIRARVERARAVQRRDCRLAPGVGYCRSDPVPAAEDGVVARLWSSPLWARLGNCRRRSTCAASYAVSW